MIATHFLVCLLLCFVDHAKSRAVIQTLPTHNEQLRARSSAKQLFRREPPPPVRYTVPIRGGQLKTHSSAGRLFRPAPPPTPVRYTHPTHNEQLGKRSSTEQLFPPALPPPPVWYTPPNLHPSYGGAEIQLWADPVRHPPTYWGPGAPATGGPAGGTVVVTEQVSGSAVWRGHAKGPRAWHPVVGRPAGNFETPIGHTKPNTGETPPRQDDRIAINKESLPRHPVGLGASLQQQESSRSVSNLRYLAQPWVPGKLWDHRRPPSPTVVENQRLDDRGVTPPLEFFRQESLPGGPSPNSKLDPDIAPPGRGWMWPGRENLWGPPVKDWDPELARLQGLGRAKPNEQHSSEVHPWPKPPPGRGWPLAKPPKY